MVHLFAFLTAVRKTVFALAFLGLGADNSHMTLIGHSRDGVIVLDGGVTLPDGTPVAVVPSRSPRVETLPNGCRILRFSTPGHRVQLPLVASANPGSIRLTPEQMDDLLYDDVSSGR